MPHCENCDKSFENTDEVEHEEVPEMGVEETADGPPQIRIGTGKRDVWRCKGCGTVLGVR
jgi:hypothetical protein